MTDFPPFTGVYAVRWQQTEIDGSRGLAPEWLRIGASWSWHGESLRLDGAPSVLPLQTTAPQRAMQVRARQIAARLCGDILPLPPADDAAEAPPDGVTLTDGHACFRARIIASQGDWFLAFDGALPPAGRVCWVMACNLPASPVQQLGAQDVICFASDATIATPDGPRPIATLRAGDLVTTRDNGPRPVLWIGQSTLSGLALRRYPHLRPIRLRRNAVLSGIPDADLRVSPAHRVLVQGPRARALFGCDEVLAQARDLVDYDAIAPDLALHGVTYVHLLFEAHQVIFANGLASESFHPALTPARTLRQHRQTLSRLAPQWLDRPEAYGPAARRCLSAGEAALLAA